MSKEIDQRRIHTLRAEIEGVIPNADKGVLPPAPSLVEALPEGYGRSFLTKVAFKSGDIMTKVDRRVKTQRDKRRLAGALKHFSFPHHENPEVSIIIPVYNKLPYTTACLESLYAHLPKNISSQIVVVDNASADNTPKIANVPGILYIRNEKNEGFVGGCNIGASRSSGKYLVFLNNDAVITEGWLSALYDTISTRENIGLVGSKILYMDGRLQEAGGVVFSDGSGNNYGRTDHPDRYKYNYVREVDYCSGASIIIARSLFEKFGGFDELYAPAYYEDTDLAFKVRKSGMKVLYQPSSVIYHIEGGTSGTDTSSGFKRFQEINHKKFLKRWRSTLQKDHLTGEDLFLARDRSKQKLALVIDELVPTPEEDSGSVRMFRLLTALSDVGYKVTFYPNNVLSANSPSVKALQQYGIEVVYGPTDLHEILYLYGKYYDLVLLSRPRIASLFLDACNAYCTKAKIVFDTVDLHFLRLGRQAEIEPDTAIREKTKRSAFLYENLEKKFMKEVDYTLVVSDVEKRILEQQGIENVEIVSNIHTPNAEAFGSTFLDRKDLLFVGGYRHVPNVDAIEWFVQEIFPRIKKSIPDIKLHVVGSHMPEGLRKELKKSEGVIVHGFLSDDDLRSLLISCRVFVAPLRYGAGVKGKIGQAVEFGIPVVSTEVGVEGMHLSNEVSALTAKNPEDFAQKVTELYQNPALWLSLRTNARKQIEKHFSVEAAKVALRKI